MSSPPHILHVFPTFVAAGAQQRTLALIEGFGADYRHSILALDGRLDGLELAPPDLSVEPVTAPTGPGSPRRRLAVELARLRPELLCTYNWGSFDAVLAARSSGVPHVHHEDGFNADEARRQKLRRVIARRFALRRAYRVVVPSARLAEIATKTWGLPRVKVAHVPNGIRIERFATSPEEGARTRAELGIEPDAVVVGAVGHLRAVKRFDRLIESCAALPSDVAGGRAVHLLVLGDGEERARLEALARTRRPPGGDVHLVGHRDGLARWYAAMDAFCISSDSEQHPVSLLEAMASRVPVAATDVGDVRSVLPSGAAEDLVDVGTGDPAAGLALALARLLGDADLRRSRAEAAFERVRDVYAFDPMLSAYRAIYDGAIGPRSPASG